MYVGFARLRNVLAASLLAAVAAGVVGVGTVSAHASTTGTDPLVVVAQVAPTSYCKLVTSSTDATGNQVTTTTPCPAGSVVGTAFVLLSQARAAGEPYVVLPDQNASLAAQAAAQQQIFALLEAKTPHPAHQNVGASKPVQYSCTASKYVSAYWYPSFDNATEYYSQLQYESCPNNTVYLQQSLIKQVSGFGYYWNQDKYAGGSWGRGCQGISSNGNYGGLNQTHNAGYYYEPWVASGSNCTSWDSYSYLNIGPVS